jgi:hypothetical protein
LNWQGISIHELSPVNISVIEMFSQLLSHHLHSLLPSEVLVVNKTHFTEELSFKNDLIVVELRMSFMCFK